MSGYTHWSEHGELLIDRNTDNIVSNYDDVDDSDDDNRDNLNEMLVDLEDDVPDKDFQQLIEDNEKPLYKGCKKFTKLSVVLKLFNLKANNGWSDKSFTGTLEAINEMLPEANELPISIYQAKKIMCAMDLDIERIHACRNDCILYRNEHANLHECVTCGTSRYLRVKQKEYNSDVTKNGPPAKLLWYLPIIPRLKRLFANAKDAKLLRWHAEERKRDGKMRHVADSPQWRNIDHEFEEFGDEIRNIRFGLSADGINLFKTMSSRHSTWPVLLCIYNLPPWLCMKRKYIMMSLLIQCPKQPGNDIDVYLAPLIEDMKKLWISGVEVYDTYKKEHFQLRAMIYCTISDFPAYANLSGYSTKGKKACPVCEEYTRSMRLKNCNKTVYMGHRQSLPRNHLYRTRGNLFDGKYESEYMTPPMDGNMTFDRVRNLEVVFGKCSKNKQPNNWKKRSIFWELPYWKTLDVRHCLDVMHIEKNVCESLIRLLLNNPKRPKDELHARDDMVAMGIRPELAPITEEGRRTYLPPACYTMSKDEKTMFCGCLHGIKVPSGILSRLKRGGQSTKRRRQVILSKYNPRSYDSEKTEMPLPVAETPQKSTVICTAAGGSTGFSGPLLLPISTADSKQILYSSRHTMDRPRRKKRSVTLVREHSEEYLANLRVQFNRYGCAIGVNRPKFASYRGVTTRKLISILIESWDQVKQCEKDNLWLTIKNIPNDDDPEITKRIKKRQLKFCNTHWKAYKSTLLKLWAAGETLETLEERYPYLDMEMFEKFLALKSTEEFQEKSRKGTETANKNKNHPHLGPSGYLADAIIQTDIHVSRGELELGPRSDVLTEVLGPEHFGGTRAMKERLEADFVLNESFIDKIVDKIVPKVVAALTQHKEDTNSVRSESSTRVLDELQNLTGPTGCELMLPYGRVRPTLAKGTVFPLKDGLIHSVPFEAGHLRVSVDRIYEEKYHSIPLPVSPDDEICVLGDALHSYIQWPGDSIRLTKPPQKDKNTGQTLEAIAEKPNQNAVADVPQVSQSGMRFTKERQQQQFSTSHQIVPPVQPQHDPPVSTIGKPLGPQKHPQRPHRQVGKPQFPQTKVVKGGKGSGDKSEPNGQSQSPSQPQKQQVSQVQKKVKPRIFVQTRDDYNDVERMLHSYMRVSEMENKCAFVNPQEITATRCKYDDEHGTDHVTKHLVDVMNFHENKQFFLAPC
ncbi:hypothetical protein LXL04_004873 [Taraxacum kok-saghyz]